MRKCPGFRACIAATCALGARQYIRQYGCKSITNKAYSVANLKGSGLGRCDYDFSDSQPWCKTSQNLNFIDETPDIVNIYDRDSESDNAVTTPLDWGGSARSAPETQSVVCDSTPRPVHLRTESTGAASVHDVASPTKRRRVHSPLAAFGGSFHGSPEQASSVPRHSPTLAYHRRSQDHFSTTPGRDNTVADPLNDVETFAAPEPAVAVTSDIETDFSTISDKLPQIYLDAPVWPLRDRQEAELMRYFVNRIAKSFDLADPGRHFELLVPQRAAICPTLLNAVFAASARHLSRVTDFDPFVADGYHQKCLKHLIPMLSDTTAIMDENLLAATVILRYLEEVESKFRGPCVRPFPLLSARKTAMYRHCPPRRDSVALVTRVCCSRY